MKNDTTIRRAEALLRFMRYTSPDRRQAIQVGKDIWVDKETATGKAFALNTEHELPFFDETRESGRYRVAMLPLVRRVADPRSRQSTVLHVTVYVAKADEWHLFPPLDTFTLDDVRQSMLCPDEEQPAY